MKKCDRYLHIIHIVPGFLKTYSNTTYDENEAFHLGGASWINTNDGGGNSWIKTECSEATVRTQIPHILKVDLYTTYGSKWSRKETYPKSPQYNVDDSGGDQTTGKSTYYIYNERTKPDFWLGIPGEQYQTTEFVVIDGTGNDPFGFNLRALMGEPHIIDEWIRRNSNNYTFSRTIDLFQQYGGWKMGTGTESVEQYHGSKVGCRISEEAVLRYPWCGLGGRYINLCTNDIGGCDKTDCCDCCAIGERFLQVFKI